MFAEKLKELRTKEKLTQVAFANAFNVSSGTVAMWETGKRTPDASTLKKIADFFKVSVDALIGDTIHLSFYPSDYEECIIECPICGYNFSHFSRILDVSFENIKSSGIAIEFDCEGEDETFGEHKFYIVIETYKGNSYLSIAGQNDVFLSNEKLSTNSFKKTIYDKNFSDIPFEIKKYRTLDRHGKKAIAELLETEYERCTEVIDEPKVITLPMAELKASAGTGQWLGDDEYTTRVDVLDTPEARRANVVIEVSGDSMEPRYHDGDKVLVKLQPTVEQNEIGIFIVDNCGYIKKLGVNELISVNKEYDNIPLNEYNDVTCVGKVVGIAEII